MKKEEEINIKSRKTILKSGQGWTLPAQVGSRKQDKMEKSCCEVICGAPTTSQCFGTN